MIRALAVAVVLSAGASWACSCVEPATFFPVNGATKVPANVRPVVTLGLTASPRVTFLGPDQKAVEFTTEAFGNGVRLTPTSVLPAGVYVLDAPDTRSGGSTFTVGTERDVTAPVAPSFTQDETIGVNDRICGGAERRPLTIDADDDAAYFGVFLDDQSEPVTILGRAAPELTNSFCDKNFPRGQTGSISVRAYDLAGNESASTETAELKTITYGCSTTPGLLPILFLLPLLRRRSHGR